MELSSSDKERIQHQYDALAKKTLVGEAKSYRRTLAKRAAREITFSDLSESELAQLFTTDEYESDYYRFQVSGFDVLVKNELLAEALNALPERKRDIILLSYFLDMSDAEIGEPILPCVLPRDVGRPFLPPAEWMALTLSSRGVRALCAAEPIAFPLPIAGGEATLSAAAAGRATVLI
mgnify:CR=1 FL=1